MKHWINTFIIGFAIVSTLAFCQWSNAAKLVTSTVDAGGKRTTSANYGIDGSLGGVIGVSSAAAPAQAVKHGYIGQLYDVVSLTVIGTPSSVAELDSTQLSGMANLDDNTTLVLSGSDINWSVLSGPVNSIDATGLATTEAVYTDTEAEVQGMKFGVNDSTLLVVLNTLPDNFGSYAGDGLPDDWQVVFFGLDNPDAAPGEDPDADGQNNEFEYTAGVIPTDNTSLFGLRIEAVNDQPTHKNLIFSPIVAGRVYTPEFRTDLVTGSYANLIGFQSSDNGNVRTVTDLNATDVDKFYRIGIGLTQ